MKNLKGSAVNKIIKNIKKMWKLSTMFSKKIHFCPQKVEKNTLKSCSEMCTQFIMYSLFFWPFRHLESVRPLCDDNEFNKFVQLGQEFESTLGKKLQRWLQLKWWTSDNYVSDWWEEYVYLRGKFWIIICYLKVTWLRNVLLLSNRPKNNEFFLGYLP